MWLHAARNRFLARFLTALLAVIVCGGALDWGHIGGDDSDCNPVVVAHNHAAHRLASGRSSPSTGDHCYICHALRLLHVGLTARRERPTLHVRRGQHLSPDSLAASDTFRVSLTSRAPPAIRL